MSLAIATPKQQFLEAYEREHATTLKVLQAMPEDQLSLKPHPRCKTARELAWVFVLERGLGKIVFNDGFASGSSSGKLPDPPEAWPALLEAYQAGHKELSDLVRETPDTKLLETVRFFTAPKTMSDVRRIDFLWFLLHDEIHHRGQFSIYLRMAGAKVPSIYGPSADEPWM